MATRKSKLSDLTPDPRNANKGTERGTGMLEKSLRKYGAGRSILIDKAGKVIAGNKTLQGAADIGLDDVLIVQTDGTQLVAVQRTDLDLDSKEARELAIADNRTSEVGLDWDTAELEALIADGVELGDMFWSNELSDLLNDKSAADDPNAIWQGMPEFEQSDKSGYQKIVVHFATPEDVEKFAKLVGQKLTSQTRAIWYPQAEIERTVNKVYTDES